MTMWLYVVTGFVVILQVVNMIKLNVIHKDLEEFHRQSTKDELDSRKSK
jgi:hypothetical protein